MDNVCSQFIDNFGKQVLLNEPMKNHTSFKVGGRVDVLFLPKTVEEINKALLICSSSSIPYYIMGNGSNLLVKDEGFKGVIIKLASNFRNYIVNDNEIIASAGILLPQLSNIALKNCLTGLEFASGIPGTLGGAIFMNAGAYGGEMKDVVVSCRILTKEGELLNLTYDELDFGYRTSMIQTNGGIVLETKIKLSKGSFDDIKAKIDEFYKMRKLKQPLGIPSAGSTFKRPAGHFAGKLIMDSGLMGYKIGGAQVSEKHCGFIINAGNATAKDILNLIQHIQNTVLKNFNVVLEPEVKIIG